MPFVDPDDTTGFIDPDEGAKAPSSPSRGMMSSSLDYYQGLGHDALNLGKEVLQGKHMIGPVDFAKGLADTAYGTVKGATSFAFDPITGGAKALAGQGDWQKNTEELLRQHAHEPTTEFGDVALDAIGNILNQVGIPGSQVFHGIGRASLPKELQGKSFSEKLDKLGEPPKAPETKFIDPDAQGDMFGHEQGPAMGLSPEQIADMKARDAGQGDLFTNPQTFRDPNQIAQDQQQQRYASVQAAIDARQKEMEFQVARQGNLDRGAADRARQQNAPVPGLEEAQSRAIDESIGRTQDLNKRGQQMGIVEDYGNNDPMSRMPEMRVDENGIPIRSDLSMEAQNLENPLQRNLWGDELPAKSKQEGVPLTQAIDRMPPAERRGAIDSQFRPPKGQRGAINVDDVKAAIDYFKKGFASAKDVLASFKGTFHPVELRHMMDNLNNPKSRDTVVLMSPDQFHQLAEYRDPSYTKSQTAENRRASIREGLKSENGLTSMPYLGVDYTKDGKVAQVFSHEGRHRMDVFKEQGIDLVPVRIKHMGFRWGEEPVTSAPKELRPQDMEGLGDNHNIPLSDNLTKRYPASQRGVMNIGDIYDTFDKMVGRYRSSVEDYLSKTVPGVKAAMDKAVLRPDSSDKIIKDSLAHGEDTPPLWNNVQSGPILTSAKFKDNPLILGVGRWLRYANAKTQYAIRTIVQPLEKQLSRLSKGEMNEVWEAVKRESFAGTEYGADSLRDAGFNQRQIDGYTMLRKALNDTFELQNETNKTIGKKPLTKLDAYMSATWHGDWHTPIMDKDGNLAWYIRTPTRFEANKAIKYLKENFPDLDISDKTKAEHRPGNQTFQRNGVKYPETPRDVMGGYQDMLGYFSDNPKLSAEIREAMEEYTQHQSYGVVGQNQHFKFKSGVRGFEGDRPWKSDADNAYAGMKAQMQYLKDAYKWSHMQEMMANVKEVMSHPELNDKMPNAMQYTKMVVGSELGMTGNVFRGLEDAVAGALGVSRSSLGRTVSDAKTMTYLQMLGANLAYFIATPLQAMVNTPSWHRILTNQGFEHNVGKTTLKAMGDFSAGIANHYAHELIGKDANIPMTKIGREALDNAVESGFIAKNLFDENKGLKEHPGFSQAKSALNMTLNAPEKLARLSAYMSFVHHLDESGKFATHAEIFRRAEELTGMAITDFHSTERPLIVGKAGIPGNLAYVFKSFLFNQANQWSAQVRSKAALPILSSVGLMVALGGLMSTPMMNEMDGLFNLFKDAVANWAPEHYKSVSGPGLKGNIMKFGDLPAFGVVSNAMNAQMYSRFSPAFVDPERPLSGIAPVAQEMKEWGGIGRMAVDRDRYSAAEALYQNSPALLKGNLETGLDTFKGPKRGENQMYLNPNHMNSQSAQFLRTPEDENYRRLGMYSLPEAKTKQWNYINDQENARIKTATENLMDKTFKEIRSKDFEGAAKYAKAYLELNPDSDAFAKDLQAKIEGWGFSPQEREVMHASTIEMVLRVKRRMQLEK